MLIMRVTFWLLAVALAVSAFLGAVSLIIRGSTLPHASSARVYNLAAVHVLVESRPEDALGQILLLRATPVQQWCFDWVIPANGTCRLLASAFVAAESGDHGQPVVLAFGDTPPLAALLRQVPLLGPLMGKPQVIAWAKPSIYRVELQRAPCIAGERRTCFHAVVQDVAQG